MCQKCVKNAPKCGLFYWERETFQNASKMSQTCITNTTRMRGRPWGENTFWTIPNDGAHPKKRKWSQDAVTVGGVLPDLLWKADFVFSSCRVWDCDWPLPTQGLPSSSRPEPRKSSKRVPQARAPRVPKECAPESQKSPKRV